jgi:hypothetical protein
MSILQNSNAISAGGYDINNSLRFRQSATAYLSRTFTTPTNNKIGTISLWRKRGSPGTYDTIYGTVSTTTGNGPYIQFNTDSLRFIDNSSDLMSSQVFRDYSAWYHIVVAIDTTQATASNRVKIYVNGSQITAFSSATYGALNYNSDILSSGSQYIGYSQPSNARGAEGYLAEVNFIDGQALTPSSFGETDAVTGVWKAKKYTGTYGTNGFYLKFSDIATTSGSNTGLGKDFSGNGNYFNTNNISVTSGSTYDAMKDSPTNTSPTVANYATLLALRPTLSQGNYQNANLEWNQTSAGSGSFVCSSIGVFSGKWYAEFSFSGSVNSTSSFVGFGTMYNIYGLVGYRADGKTEGGATFGSSYTTGDIIGVAYDQSTNTATFYKNNVSQGTQSFTIDQAVGGAFVASTIGNGSIIIANFGQRPFSYTPPTGFVALNTYNLPDSTIKKGNKYMDATTYTGNGSSGKAVTNTAAFKPDFVWIKDRTAANYHILTDSVRGVGLALYSNGSFVESAYNAQTLQSFNTNGFTVGSNGDVNTNTNSYVGWQWQAGQGSTSSNTSGSITSTVSVNATAGFSIVTYTGNNTSGATVGHGLGVVPAMVICKNRSAGIGSGAWPVWHKSLTGGTYYLFLNTTAAQSNANNNFTATPTSTVLNLGTSDTNNTATMVAYCWAEIAGFSKFGSYTGNGSTDGPFIYLGFRPKYFLIKRIDSAGFSWNVVDSSTSPYNVTPNELQPNTSGAESTGNTTYDFISNGVKIRTTSTDKNASGGTYIYAAFAENPFKNSLAR